MRERYVVSRHFLTASSSTSSTGQPGMCHVCRVTREVTLTGQKSAFLPSEQKIDQIGWELRYVELSASTAQ